MRRISYLIPALVVILVLALSSVFIVDERNKALVLQFGRVVAIKEDPGLSFKVPFIQNVVYYEDRILSSVIDPLEVTPLDDRRLVVDAFTRYRISDVNQFREAVGTGGELAAEGRLDGMRAEREREAADEIARGNEAAQRVRALADRTEVEIVSDARRDAEIIRGEADAERNAIFANAFGEDPEFFEFYRSLTAYKNALQGKNSTMVISPDSEFFDYLKSDIGLQ